MLESFKMRENAGILLLFLVAHRAVCCVRTKIFSVRMAAATPTLKRHERGKKPIKHKSGNFHFYRSRRPLTTGHDTAIEIDMVAR